MFAIPGVVAVLVLIYARPQEFIEQLQGIPFLYLFFALALLGWLVDLRLRKSRPLVTPQLVPAILFFLWAVLSVVGRAPGDPLQAAKDLMIPFALFLMVANMVQSFRAFQVVAATVLLLALYLAFVGVHQGMQPLGCHRIDETSVDAIGIFDGRPCALRDDCEQGDVEPGADYMCEHPGLFGTSSIAAGRVRYRGSLNDPNALAMTATIALPLAFALFERRRSTVRLLLLLASLGLMGTCTVFSQSRGGQLVFLTVLATYFIRQFGLRGLIATALVALPIVLLGGREGESAESSSEQRIEDLYAAMTMFRQYPIRGVGFAQILEYHSQTAHNSYALACAELGFPGLVLWTSALSMSLRVPITALRRYAGRPEAQVARTWAMGLLAAIAGMSVGIFFLSFSYHQIFWVFMGLSAAFYAACKAHDPDFEIPFRWANLARLLAFDAMLAMIMYTYTRIKVK